MALTYNSTSDKWTDSITINKQTGSLLTLTTDNKYVNGNIEFTIGVKNGSATTPADTVPVSTITPSFSSNKLQISCSGSKSITPSVSAGWVSSGTVGTISASGSTSVSSLTLTKGNSFTIDMQANTTTDNTKLTINNANYRNILIDNKVTTNSKVSIKAKETSSATTVGSEQIVIENGYWKLTSVGTTTNSAFSTSYGKTIVYYGTLAVDSVESPTNSTVTPSITAPSNASTYGFTTTKPSSGTYLTFTPNMSATAWSVTPRVKISKAGYFAANTTGTNGTAVSNTPVKIADSSITSQYVPVVTCSFGGGGITATTNFSKNDLAVTLADGSDKNVAAACYTVGAKDTTNYPYYIKISGSTPAVSGTTTATRAKATYTNSAGVIAAHSATQIWAAATASPTVSVNAASGSTYVGMVKAAVTVAGTNTVTPSATLSKADSYVTWSGEDNGISVTATGGGTASVTATATTSTPGYAPASTQIGSQTLTASSNTTTDTKYITGIKVPANTLFDLTSDNNASAGEETEITVQNGLYRTMTVSNTSHTSSATDASVLTVINGNYRHVFLNNKANGIIDEIINSGTLTTLTNNGTITTLNNTGTVTVQSASTSSGNVTINAYNSSNSLENKSIVSGGKWVETTASAATTYWGKVTVPAVSPAMTFTAAPGGSSTATGSNVTLQATTTDPGSGIFIQTKYTITSTAIKYNSTSSGWVSVSANNATGSTTTAKSATNGTKYYIKNITIASSKSLSITNGGTAVITNAGTTTFSTNTGTVNITTNSGRTIITNNTGSAIVRHSSAAGSVAVRSTGTSNDVTVVSSGSLITTSVSQNAVTTISGSTITRAISQWGTGWITGGEIAAATFANTATSGRTYVDISNFAPVLTSGGFLYINRGYVDDLQISLGSLIPDSYQNLTFAEDIHMLSGYVGFNNEGVAVTGTISTFTGAYNLLHGTTTSGSLTDGATFNRSFELDRRTGTVLTLLTEDNKYVPKNIAITMTAREASPTFSSPSPTGGSTASTPNNNVTLSSTDNGIKIQTAYSINSANFTYNAAVDGWVTKSSGAAAGSTSAVASTNGTAYYVEGISLPKSQSFDIEVYEDTSSQINFHFATDANGNTVITEE